MAITVTLRSAHGTFLTVDTEGRVKSDALIPREWEQIVVERIDDHSCALKSWQGFYLTADSTGEIIARQKNVFDWERWQVRDGEATGSVAFINAHGNALTVLPEGTVVCKRPEVHAWESLTADPANWWDTQAPPSAHPDPLVGKLRIDNGAFADDTGLVLPTFAHGGDWLAVYVRDKERVRRVMDHVAGVGYHGVRTWMQLGCGNDQLCPLHDHLGRPTFWRGLEVGPDLTPNYWTHLGEFLSDLRDRELYLASSQGDPSQLGHSMAPRRQRAKQYADTFKHVDGTGHTVAFFDCGNEALWNDGDRLYSDPANCAEFIKAFKDAGGTALCTFTSPENETADRLNDYSTPPADLWDVHGYRDDHWWDKRRHIFSITYEGKPKLRLGIQSEPFGNGQLVSASGNKQELDHEAMANGAAMSFIARQAWVWFSGEGVKDTGHLHEEQGFAASANVRKHLPDDIMRFRTLHHCGDSWQQRGVAVFILPTSSALVRCDGVMNDDGRFAYIMDGPSGRHPFGVARNFTGMITNLGTGETHPFDGRTGATLPVEWTRGRLVVGQVG